MNRIHASLSVCSLLAIADFTLAHYAIHVYPDSPGYERAKLAEEVFFPAMICGVLAIALFWLWMQRRTGASTRVVCALLLTLALFICSAGWEILGDRMSVIHHELPRVGERRDYWFRNELSLGTVGPLPPVSRPLTSHEAILLGLVISFGVGLLGFGIAGLRNNSVRSP
jgi:hypothetical protein